MKELFFLLIAFALVFSGTVWAQGNIAELKILEIENPVAAGSDFDFSFLAGNNVGPACAAKIQYWFEAENESVVQGNDVIFLEEGTTKIETVSLKLPHSMEGVRDFFLLMQCNDANVLASRVVDIGMAAPSLPKLSSLRILERNYGEQLEFSYVLESWQGETLVFNVRETVEKDGNVLWAGSQGVLVAGSEEILRIGPVLGSGNYRIVVEAASGNETAKIVREFAVVAPAVSLPELPLAPLLSFAAASFLMREFAVVAPAVSLPELPLAPLLSFAAAAFFLIASTFFLRKIFAGRRAFRKAPSRVSAKAARELIEKKSQLCFVESQSGGIIEEFALNGLLDAAKIKGERRALAMQFALSTPVSQVVRTLVSTGEKGEMKGKTVVSAVVSNNTNSNWKKVIVLADIPDFIAESASDIDSGCEMHSSKSGSVARFVLPKIGAMQSVEIVYSVPRIISQAEANSLPLPAVIDYRQGKPLMITQVKIEKQEKAGSEAQAAALEMAENESPAQGQNALKEKKAKK